MRCQNVDATIITVTCYHVIKRDGLRKAEVRDILLYVMMYENYMQYTVKSINGSCTKLNLLGIPD